VQVHAQLHGVDQFNRLILLVELLLARKNGCIVYFLALLTFTNISRLVASTRTPKKRRVRIATDVSLGLNLRIRGAVFVVCYEALPADPTRD